MLHRRWSASIMCYMEMTADPWRPAISVGQNVGLITLRRQAWCQDLRRLWLSKQPPPRTVTRSRMPPRSTETAATPTAPLGGPHDPVKLVRLDVIRTTPAAPPAPPTCRHPHPPMTPQRIPPAGREPRERLTHETVIVYLFRLHRGTYGSLRITADLREMGWWVSPNTVAQLMAHQGLATRRKR